MTAPQTIEEKLDEILDTVFILNQTDDLDKVKEWSGQEPKDRLKQALLGLIEKEFDPFNYVEPCEPDCSPERHAYHQGQWDMAGRIEAARKRLRGDL